MVTPATQLAAAQAVPAPDWGADAPADWLGLLGAVGPWVLAALLAALLARAVLARRRYQAVDVLGDDDRRAVQDRIAAAEQRTEGEIVVVVLERSDRHPAAGWLAALLFALLGSALLVAWLPWDRPELLLTCQVLLGAVGFLCARALPDFRRRFISEERADEMAAEQALQEFHAHGLHRTEAATGVLVFVSLLERRVLVLGDEGIDAKVDAGHWERTSEAILKGIRNRCLRDGLLEGLDRCTEVLAEHFPWHSDDRDEIPNHVIVRRE